MCCVFSFSAIAPQVENSSHRWIRNSAQGGQEPHRSASALHSLQVYSVLPRPSCQTGRICSHSPRRKTRCFCCWVCGADPALVVAAIDCSNVFTRSLPLSAAAADILRGNESPRAFAHGDVEVDYTDEDICFSEYPLSAALAWYGEAESVFSHYAVPTPSSLLFSHTVEALTLVCCSFRAPSPPQCQAQ